MIVFDLSCADGHRFEGWFASSQAFEEQRARDLVTCPHCGSSSVTKAPMAPAVPVKANTRSAPHGNATNAPLAPEVQRALAALARAQAQALKNSTWVGEKFAQESRAMYYGEKDPAVIHGRVSTDEARALVEEGVPVAPLPFPVAPPDEIN